MSLATDFGAGCTSDNAFFAQLPSAMIAGLESAVFACLFGTFGATCQAGGAGEMSGGAQEERGKGDFAGITDARGKRAFERIKVHLHHATGILAFEEYNPSFERVIDDGRVHELIAHIQTVLMPFIGEEELLFFDYFLTSTSILDLFECIFDFFYFLSEYCVL